ncbi:MAG: PilZ domain-containing protein, partial [Deltaproteobacteria bacterium]|nr:PilZ domain-containing protein [Deltaproteobacteria bacterium]
MDEEGRPATSEKRLWPRVKLDARVVVSYPNLEQLVSGPLSDISLGGLFIRTPAVRPVGTQLTIKVIARSEPLEFEARGRVVRIVRPEEVGPDGPP